MYFPASASSWEGGTEGPGLWRAYGLAPGLSITDYDDTTAIVTTVYGKDFAVHGPHWTPTSSPDRIKGFRYRADEWVENYLNPAPIEMPNGSWRVYTGGGRTDMFGASLSQFKVFSGTALDGCGS